MDRKQEENGKKSIDHEVSEQETRTGQVLLLARARALRERSQARPVGAARGAERAPRAGEYGILSSNVNIQLDGERAVLAAGTAVEFVRGAGEHDRVRVKQHADSEFVATIPKGVFRPEPGIVTSTEEGVPRFDSYQKYEGELWGELGPTVNDISQGEIGDCFLMAAVRGLVQHKPEAIQCLFYPTTPREDLYQVTLHRRIGRREFQKVHYRVDRFLPSLAGRYRQPAYANHGLGAFAPLWPALLEKAYAAHVHGYQQLNSGGTPDEALEALTGQGSQSIEVKSLLNEAAVLQRFRRFEEKRQVVVCGTQTKEAEAIQQTPFGVLPSQEAGCYSGQLTGRDEQGVHVIPYSVKIKDRGNPASRSFDNGKGQIQGTAKGVISYANGLIEVRFPREQTPRAPSDLEVSFMYASPLSKELNLYAHHAYTFEGVEGEHLRFKNPALGRDPQPISAAAFLRYFRECVSLDLLDDPQS